MDIKKASVITAVAILIALIDLLVGNGLLIQLGLINEHNKSKIFYVLVAIAGIIVVLMFVVSVLQEMEGDIKTIGLSVALFFGLFGACIGFAWDILTSIIGIFSVLTTPPGAVGNKAVALVLAIAGTTVCFIITLQIPFNILNQVDNVYLKGALIVLLSLAFIFDFYTSFIGNASLLGIYISNGGVTRVVTLGICTLFVCLCQYIVFLYVRMAEST